MNTDEDNIGEIIGEEPTTTVDKAFKRLKKLFEDKDSVTIALLILQASV